MAPAIPARHSPLLRRIAGAFLLAAWFLYCSRDVLGVHFAPDDMMNIDSFYWAPGPWRLVYSQFLIWRGYYRPLGGLFYLPVYSVWGLNPAPYHVALSLVLGVAAYLVYRLARTLGAGESAAFLAAVVACYHAGLGNLYYDTAFAYDALCGCFYLAALVYYCGIRGRGMVLAPRQIAIFAVLNVCALNSKEMALTLPGIILVYELVYHPEGVRVRSQESMEWLRPFIVTSVLTVADLWGKVFGVDKLTGMEGYRPVFTWQRYLDFQKTFLGDAAFWHPAAAGLIAFWVVVTYLAWRPGARPILRFLWGYLLLTPLPIAFLPGKSQACLYIPMLGLAMFAAVLISGIVSALADVLVQEPLFRHFRQPVLAGGLIALLIFCWGRENLHRQRLLVRPAMEALGAQTWQVIGQFRALDPHVGPGSHVVFLNDPFTEWDMLFIADLWFHDRSVTVHLQRLNPVPAEDVAKAAAVFDYQEEKLMQIR